MDLVCFTFGIIIGYKLINLIIDNNYEKRMESATRLLEKVLNKKEV